MDELRNETDKRIDEILSSLNIDNLLENPEKFLKILVLKFLTDNNKMFKQATTEGKKLAESLR